MTEYTSEDQWRSLQTYVAAYLSGMTHPRDVFTISRRDSVGPPIVEFRCADASRLWFAVGQAAWDDTEDAHVLIPREGANEMAALTMEALRQAVDDPSGLRFSGSGPASSVSVLTQGGFFGGGGRDVHLARLATLVARMRAHIDVDGDVIEAAARAVGSRAFESTHNGTIADQVTAGELARLRTWVDPFSITPGTSFLDGDSPPEPAQ